MPSCQKVPATLAVDQFIMNDRQLDLFESLRKIGDDVIDRLDTDG